MHNVAIVSGEVVSKPTFAHDFKGEKFYELTVRSERKTKDVFDDVIVNVSERMCDVSKVDVGSYISVSGRFSSRNEYDESIGRSHLRLFLFANVSVEVFDERPESFELDKNSIVVDGYICKETVFRETPKGRKICDVLLAVNRKFGKTDYIPCILWGRNAFYGETLEVGTKLHLEGRIQSRSYRTQQGEDRIAYEVSGYVLTVLKDDEKSESSNESSSESESA